MDLYSSCAILLGFFSFGRETPSSHDIVAKSPEGFSVEGVHHIFTSQPRCTHNDVCPNRLLLADDFAIAIAPTASNEGSKNKSKSMVVSGPEYANVKTLSDRDINLLDEGRCGNPSSGHGTCLLSLLSFCDPCTAFPTTSSALL